MDDFLFDDPPVSDDSAVISLWKKKDKKAQAIIGLSLSNELLENVRDITSTKDMWTSIKNVFERHTLLNKLAARKKFYTASMASDVENSAVSIFGVQDCLVFIALRQGSS